MPRPIDLKWQPLCVCAHISGCEMANSCYHITNRLCCQIHTLVLWNVAAGYCAHEKKCGLWWVKSQIFRWILQLRCCKGNVIGLQIQHGRFVHLFKIWLVVAIVTDLFMLNISLFHSPDCTWLVNTLGRRISKLEQVGRMQWKVLRFYSQDLVACTAVLHNVLFFFRLETILEFVFSLLVSVTYTNKRWRVDVDSVFWINILFVVCVLLQWDCWVRE